MEHSSWKIAQILSYKSALYVSLEFVLENKLSSKIPSNPYVNWLIQAHLAHAPSHLSDQRDASSRMLVVAVPPTVTRNKFSVTVDSYLTIKILIVIQMMTILFCFISVIDILSGRLEPIKNDLLDSSNLWTRRFKSTYSSVLVIFHRKNW